MEKRLTEVVIGAAFTVSNTLGCGFLEGVYVNAMAIELGRLGVAVQRQSPYDIEYRGVWVGRYIADMVVENTHIVEVKAAVRLSAEHEAQVLNYLRASRLTVGLLLNFGRPKVEFRRLVHSAPE